jgi:hypothetical protein
LGDITHQAVRILTFKLSKASPGACRTYLPESLLIFLLANVLCTYVYKFNEDVAILSMFTLPYYPYYPFCSIWLSLDVLCLVLANNRRRVVGFTRMYASFYLNGILKWLKLIENGMMI